MHIYTYINIQMYTYACIFGKMILTYENVYQSQLKGTK